MLRARLPLYGRWLVCVALVAFLGQAVWAASAAGAQLLHTSAPADQRMDAHHLGHAQHAAVVDVDHSCKNEHVCQHCIGGCVSALIDDPDSHSRLTRDRSAR